MAQVDAPGRQTQKKKEWIGINETTGGKIVSDRIKARDPSEQKICFGSFLFYIVLLQAQCSKTSNKFRKFAIQIKC